MKPGDIITFPSGRTLIMNSSLFLDPDIYEKQSMEDTIDRLLFLSRHALMNPWIYDTKEKIENEIFRYIALYGETAYFDVLYNYIEETYY